MREHPLEHVEAAARNLSAPSPNGINSSCAVEHAEQLLEAVHLSSHELVFRRQSLLREQATHEEDVRKSAWQCPQPCRTS